MIVFFLYLCCCLAHTSIRPCSQEFVQFAGKVTLIQPLRATRTRYSRFVSAETRSQERQTELRSGWRFYPSQRDLCSSFNKSRHCHPTPPQTRHTCNANMKCLKRTRSEYWKFMICDKQTPRCLCKLKKAINALSFSIHSDFISEVGIDFMVFLVGALCNLRSGVSDSILITSSFIWRIF